MDKQTTDKPKLYFAHPIGTYGSHTEALAMIDLKKLFPQYDIINPADTRHQQLARRSSSYFNELLNQCDCLVYIPFADGKIGIRTARDIAEMLKKNGEVHEIHLTEQGKPTGMCTHITSLDRERVLNIDETAMRNASLYRRG